MSAVFFLHPQLTAEIEVLCAPTQKCAREKSQRSMCFSWQVWEKSARAPSLRAFKTLLSEHQNRGARSEKWGALCGRTRKLFSKRWSSLVAFSQVEYLEHVRRLWCAESRALNARNDGARADFFPNLSRKTHGALTFFRARTFALARIALQFQL